MDTNCGMNDLVIGQKYTGVLFLHKTYGRDAKGRLLYSCISFSKVAFLVPYDVKIGFHKNVVNKYVLFSFKGWEKGKTMGVLDQVFGDVSSQLAYYDYLLHSHHLFRNTAWSKQVVDLGVRDNSIECVGETAFTVDCAGTTDFDDAFRFEIFEDKTCRISVFITDVASFVFGLPSCSSLSGIHPLDKVCSGVSTMYLPHRRIPMLLDCISQQVRLVAGAVVPCVAVRFVYNYTTGYFIRAYSEKSVVVRVERNYSYAEFECGLAGGLFDFTRKMPEFGGGGGFKRGGGDVVAFWMVQYNRYITGVCLGKFMFRRPHDIDGSVGDRLMDQQAYSLGGMGGINMHSEWMVWFH